MKFISKENLKEFKNKTCFLRVDFNFEPTDDHLRIEAIIPTIKLLLEKEVGKIIIASHRGRPSGEDESLSLSPFVSIISEKISEDVFFSSINNYKENDNRIVLLENLRFSEGEQVNDSVFAEKLAKLADFYVNEAFPVLHRKSASTVEITRFLPSFGGLRLKKEIKELENAINSPKSPFTLILGGAKTADKVGVIKNLWNKVDNVLLGGGPANTFLLERGVDIGDSIADKNAHELIETFAFTEKVKIPTDFVKEDNMILDLGKETLENYSEIISNSNTIVWNGPMGKFEDESFAEGTKSIWESIFKNNKAKIIIGGGETTSSMNILGDNIKVPDNVFLSTGGGAMLEFLTGKELPGIKSLNQKENG